MKETRRIRFGGRELGEFDRQGAMRMIERGEIDPTAEYWSKTAKAWKPMASFKQDFEDPQARVEMMRCTGIRFIEVVGGGNADCDACKAIQNQKFSVIHAPILPPAGCTCVPWCECSVKAAP